MSPQRKQEIGTMMHRINSIINTILLGVCVFFLNAIYNEFKQAQLDIKELEKVNIRQDGAISVHAQHISRLEIVDDKHYDLFRELFAKTR